MLNLFNILSFYSIPKFHLYFKEFRDLIRGYLIVCFKTLTVILNKLSLKSLYSFGTNNVC